jgi:DNA-binding transcriptional LysR family regulator
VEELREEIFVGFDVDLVIAKKIDRYLKDHGVDANVAVRFDNIEAAKRAVEAGSGVAILPRPTLERELQLGTLAAVPLAGRRFTRPLGIIHRKGRKLYPNTEAFIEVLKNSRGATAFGEVNGAHLPRHATRLGQRNSRPSKLEAPARTRHMRAARKKGSQL